MEQSLKKYCVFLTLLIIIGCRHVGPVSNPFTGPCYYESYAPVKESVTFINNHECVYTQYGVEDKRSICSIDTCYWKYRADVDGVIILYRKTDKGKRDVSADLDFVYDICPKWYSITQGELRNYADYKYLLFQDRPMSRPLGSTHKENPTFAERYGNHRIVCDTLINYGPFMLWCKSPVPVILFSNGKEKLNEINFIEGLVENVSEVVYNSYEYVNYKVNFERKVELNLDSILGRQFSFIGDSFQKESIRFINDSVCTYSLSTRINVSSPFVSQEEDSCRYSVKNNLIGIDIVKGKPCDTLTCANGFLFYSKVHKDGEKYTHIVKPFIDETRICANKTDSINMIMNTYFNVYVPINLYR